MAKPSTFKISVYPAESSNGFVSIVITQCIKRVNIEATLETVREHMHAIGQDAAKAGNFKEVHASCTPAARAPNGYSAFQAARQSQMTISNEKYMSNEALLAGIAQAA